MNDKVTDCPLTDRELIAECHKEVVRLCNDPKSWRMCVPVDLHRDSDILFSELIKRFERALNTEPQPDYDALWQEYLLTLDDTDDRGYGTSVRDEASDQYGFFTLWLTKRNQSKEPKVDWRHSPLNAVAYFVGFYKDKPLWFLSDGKYTTAPDFGFSVGYLEVRPK